MKQYDWDEHKINNERKNEIFHLRMCFLHFMKNVLQIPSQSKEISWTKNFVMNKDHYIYLIPFIEDEEKIFFKTITPSRKETKKYIPERRETLASSVLHRFASQKERDEEYTSCLFFESSSYGVPELGPKRTAPPVQRIFAC